MKIHLSPQAHDKLINFDGYHIRPRGEITVKGKGTMSTFFLEGHDEFQRHLPDDADDVADATKKVSDNSRVSTRPYPHNSGPWCSEPTRRRLYSDGFDAHSVGKTPLQGKISAGSTCSSYQEDPEEFFPVDVKSLRKTFEQQISLLTSEAPSSPNELLQDTKKQNLQTFNNAEEKHDNGYLEWKRQKQVLKMDRLDCVAAEVDILENVLNSKTEVRHYIFFFSVPHTPIS